MVPHCAQTALPLSRFLSSPSNSPLNCRHSINTSTLASLRGFDSARSGLECFTECRTDGHDREGAFTLGLDSYPIVAIQYAPNAEGDLK